MKDSSQKGWVMKIESSLFKLAKFNSSFKSDKKENVNSHTCWFVVMIQGLQLIVSRFVFQRLLGLFVYRHQFRLVFLKYIKILKFQAKMYHKNIRTINFYQKGWVMKIKSSLLKLAKFNSSFNSNTQ